jgi:hypothetical protein
MKRRAHIFDEPGFYTVTRDIHAVMRATDHVASTPCLDVNLR